MSSPSTSSAPRPRVAITLGDPAGIGPELAVRLLADPSNRAKADLFVLADRAEVDAAASSAGVSFPMSTATTTTEKTRPDEVMVLDDGSKPATPIAQKQVSQAAGERVLHQLRRGVALARAGEVDALVFPPLNKTSLHRAGMREEDELRWFAKYLGYGGTTSEINIVEDLWTARVTSHIPLAKVAENIKKDKVADAIELLHTLLTEYGLPYPRLGVCALNPHNGENGLFGREEIDEIRPGVELARQRQRQRLQQRRHRGGQQQQNSGGSSNVDDDSNNKMDVSGPFPSDVMFVPASRRRFDGVVTMFHDQGQVALKAVGFAGGVTLLGGLPLVVTTPAHGTAFDIVGRNVADLRSVQNALDVAIAVAGRRRAKAAQANGKGEYGSASTGMGRVRSML